MTLRKIRGGFSQFWSKRLKILCQIPEKFINTNAWSRQKELGPFQKITDCWSKEVNQHKEESLHKNKDWKKAAKRKASGNPQIKSMNKKLKRKKSHYHRFLTHRYKKKISLKWISRRNLLCQWNITTLSKRETLKEFWVSSWKDNILFMGSKTAPLIFSKA